MGHFTKKEVFEKIQGICNELFEYQFPDDINNTVINLVEDLGMNSIEFVTLVIKIEDYFKITIPDAYLDFELMNNISVITNLVYDLLQVVN